MTRNQNPSLKIAIEHGPLVVFFATFIFSNLMTATLALVAATVVAVAVGLAVERRIATMPLITGGVVLIFGGLTLVFQDETFIKMKPTVVQALFASVLIGGLMINKPLLKPLLKNAWHLDNLSWKILTRRFAMFFIVMAILNELVWRTQSTEFWVTYKVFGTIGLTIVFTLTQLPFINRNQLPNEDL